MMRALSVEKFGLENLAVREVPRPRPGPGEALVRVRAASLNYRDYLVAIGKYNPRLPRPLTLGSDAVGDIVEFGDAASAIGLSLGDRVVVHMVQGWLDGPPSRNATQHTLGGPLPGVFSDYVITRADSLLRAPAYLDDAEAACLPCAALTAMSALAQSELLATGATLLTQGSGGVSLFTLQLGKARGVRVLATSRSTTKRARLLALGADEVLLADAPGWGRSARMLSGGEGVEHVVEVTGGSTLAESLQAVRPGGTVSLIGTLGGSAAELDLLPIVMRNVRVQGVFVGHLRRLRELLNECERTRLRPVIDSVYDLAEGPKAFERLASGEQFGKICLKIRVS
ncbi:MAG TPA: NAD(P)-dependent alcohol dehydrogenase [Polyangiaceae bacterium]|nr:NAD(P)-dependent alcohol dehydrogenase [Polyangiaceae bacterium]